MNCNNKRGYSQLLILVTVTLGEMEKERGIRGNEIPPDFEKEKKTVHHRERKINTTGKHKGKYTKEDAKPIVCPPGTSEVPSVHMHLSSIKLSH
jgi:hypothetical protein